MPTSIRKAVLTDADHLIAFDPVAAVDSLRVDVIRRGIEAGEIFVADSDNGPIGYVLFNHRFFGNGFIELLYTRAADRRRGIASALLGRCELECQEPKLFTSANLSNTPMQSFLTKHGFVRSGVIENLDEGDPELVYFKRLTGGVK